MVIPKVSVALCTYNGAKFLREQIESIKAQTYPIDELVVCDDGSTDGTIEMVRELTEKVRFKMRIEVNESNLGSTKNFEKALRLCQNELILLCDQDDRWRRDKVEQIVMYLDQNPKKEAVFSNANIINDFSEETGQTLWESIGFDENQQARWSGGEAYKILFQGFVVTGATLAIRKSTVMRLMPFPNVHKNLIHDGWIALALGLENKIGFIADNLVAYRIHQSQQVGIGQKQRFVTLKDRFLRDRKEKIGPILEKKHYFEALHTLFLGSNFISTAQLDYLDNIKKHFQARTNLPQSRLKRWPMIVKEWRLGRYKYSSPLWWRPLLGDALE